MECQDNILAFTIIIDYIRIIFSTTDIKFVVNHILKLKFEYMIHEDY
ncbi:MAG: hypothetical protein E7J22_00090 [Clostridium perfringens]|nr:hypothetical protein [Clostridium perfringens]MDU7962723.1 hypothetical protein [Clostridium perfringens]